MDVIFIRQDTIKFNTSALLTTAIYKLSTGDEGNVH